MIGTHDEFRFGEPVYDFDGERIGRLEGACNDPESRTLMALIVRRAIFTREPGRCPSTEFVRSRTIS